MESSNKSRKIPVRSTMSDEELAEIIRRDRKERPQEFERCYPLPDSYNTHFDSIPAVCEVVAKWL